MGTWVDADDRGECHTWRPEDNAIRNKLILLWETARSSSMTWYLNKTRLWTWDHFSRSCEKIDGKELRVKKVQNGWAGKIPKCEDERQKFQELVSLPNWVSMRSG